MKNTWQRMATLALALLMVLSCLAFVACSNDTPDPDDDKSNPGNDDPGTTPSNPDDSDKTDENDYLLTIPKKNYGKTFTFLTEDGGRRIELFIADEDEAAGDTMDTAIFYRNNRVAEYLGITFENTTTTGGWNNRSAYINRIYTSFSSGDQDFQMSSVYEAFAADGAIAGYYYDINSIDSIDIEKPWYVQSWFENTIINDRCYMLLSDLSYTMWQNLNAMYFNMQISDRLGITDTLYTLASDGGFTMEVLMDCAQQSSADDGNDVWDENDTYGMYLNRFTCRAMLTYFDIPLTRMNDDGEYELCLYNEETESIYGTLHSYIWDNDCIYKNTTANDGDVETGLSMFMQDRCLFMPARLTDSQTLREMDGKFGILPMPKLDDEQDEYCSHSSDTFSVFIIPGHTNDPEFCGTVFDALSAESKYSVIPTYYDVVLKGRTTKDDESSEMLDIIRDHMSFDFAFAHITALDFMWTSFGNTLMKVESTSYKTAYDTYSSSYEANLQKVMDAYWDVR